MPHDVLWAVGGLSATRCVMGCWAVECHTMCYGLLGG